MNGTDLIAIERHRQQTEEGYDAAHDAGHAEELARAAACYAVRPEWDIEAKARRREPAGPPLGWPWDAEYWKPTPDNRIRELVKAGALIAAAIDSLTVQHTETHPETGRDPSWVGRMGNLDD